MPSRPHTHHRGTHRLHRAFARLAFLLAIDTGLSLPLFAQSSTQGALAGRMPGASIALGEPIVTARDNDSGAILQIRGSQSGDFLLPLPPGEYTVEVEMPGLPMLRRDHVSIALGEVTRLPTARSAQPSLSLQINPPLPALRANESPDAADQLQQAANSDSDSEAESLPSFRGLPATQNSTRVDGGEQTQSFSGTSLGSGSPIDPNDAADAAEGPSDASATTRNLAARSIRGASAPFTLARSAIREFRLTGSTYSALYGNAPGGILAATTRSGANRLAGSAFFTLRSSAFAATNPYAIATTYSGGTPTSTLVKPQDSRRQYGAALGGPIIRNRLFFFTALDAQRRDFPAISSPQDPNFYTLSATQRALLLNRGVRSANIVSALNYLDSLTGPAPRRADGNVVFGRLDFRLTRAATLALQANISRWNQPAGYLSAPVVSRARASLGNTTNNADTFLLRQTFHLTTAINNELRIQYGHAIQFQSAQPPLPQEPAIGPDGLPPEVAIGPQGLTFGTPATLGRSAYPDETRLQFADLLSIVHGRHHVQLGVEYSSIHTLVSALTNQQGTFRYDSAVTTPGRAGGLVDWITDYTFNVNAYPNGGCPSINAPVHLFCFRSFTQSFGAQSVTFDTHETAAFLQEDIRLTSRLTLHAGVRADKQSLPPPQNPNPALDKLFPTQAVTSAFPEDRFNAAPRLALAWQITAHTTLRAGYGLYFGRLPGATLRAALLNTDLPSSTTHIRILPSTITTCPQVQNQGFGYRCAYLTSPASALPTTTSATLFSRRFRLPAVQQASFAIERELPAGIMLTATLRANLDRQLPSSVDLNIAPSTAQATYQLHGGIGLAGVRDGEIFLLPLYTVRRFSTVGPVTAITSDANATYNGLTVEAHRRSPTLAFSTAFTYSRAIDFNPTEGAIPHANHQLDPYNLRYDKGLSNLNYPYRFTISATWQPHLANPHRHLRLLANNWFLTPFYLQRSGSPYSLTLSGGTRLSGGNESLNGSGGALYLPTVGRNTLRLPSAANLDLRLARAIPLRESLTLRLSAEAFNLVNRVNLAGITQRAYLVGTPTAGITPLVFQDASTIAAEGLNTRPFGAFTDSGTSEARARQLQFGLQIQF